jgi:hypothetical protein
MTEYKAHGEWTKRGAWYPVKNRCGHYEARYMNSGAITESSMPCTACDLLGRECGIQQHYDTREACLEWCYTQAGRGKMT